MLASCKREAAVLVRRRPGADREIYRAAAPYRGAGVRRQPRQCRPPVRARLLAAAPPPEGDRGGAGAGHGRGDPRRGLRGGGQGGARRSTMSARARSSSSPTRREGLRADRIWFMEMNTRLQVEHPVTEEITGAGSGRMAAARRRGRAAAEAPGRARDPAACAIEARLYAEDPAHQFLPSTGRLDHFVLPRTLRIETGVEEGDRITPLLRSDDRQADRARRRAGNGRSTSWSARSRRSRSGR